MESIVTNLDLFVILQNSGRRDDYIFLFEAVMSRYCVNLREEDQIILKEFCRRFKNSLEKRWKSAHRKMETFQLHYSSWLEAEVDWPSCLKENVPEAISLPANHSDSICVAAPSSSKTVGTMTKKKHKTNIAFDELSTKQKKGEVRSTCQAKPVCFYMQQ